MPRAEPVDSAPSPQIRDVKRHPPAEGGEFGDECEVGRGCGADGEAHSREGSSDGWTVVEAECWRDGLARARVWPYYQTNRAVCFMEEDRMPPSVEARMLGTFQVSVGGHEVRHWRAGKARSLMQYLIIRRNTVVSRDVLNEALWPGDDGPAGYSSLKVAAHALRKTVVGVDGNAHGTPVSVDFEDFGYVLRAEDAWTDVDAFEQHAHAGAEAEAREDAAGAVREFKAAAALYRGSFLDGEDATWVVEQRVWYQAIALKVYQRLARLALESGNEFEAIKWCRRAVELDPCNERNYQTLMRLHARGGELGMALKWYAQCESRLERELGVAVSEATRRTLVGIVGSRVA